MKFSVLIPAYNAAKTIRATVDSVLAQTVPAHEIIVFNDGSRDDTAAILQGYGARLTVLQDTNHGLSYVRNQMGNHASGDMLAFLDADDTWHPRYLATQQHLMEKYPAAAAYYTEHEDTVGLGEYQWPKEVDFLKVAPEVLQPIDLLRRSNQTPLKFQMSGCCVPRHIFAKLGPEPFQVNGAEDTFFNALIALVGPAVRTSAKPVAYRIIEGSESSNRLKCALAVVEVFRILEEIYRDQASAEMFAEFRAIRAARRRNCAKYLMGSGQVPEGRAQLKDSLRQNHDSASIAKSLGLLFASYLPRPVQPKNIWLGALRKDALPKELSKCP